jgi:2'-5' RNA ligase
VVKKMRLFVGIEIDKILKSQISALQDDLKKHVIKGKWKDPLNIHITLKYLGPVPIDKIETIGRELERLCSRIHSFSLRLGDIGFFYKAERIKVMWLGVSGDLVQLHDLYSGVENSMEKLGFERENRDFKPHVTLAQNIDFNDDGPIKLNFIKKSDFEIIHVKEICIFESVNIDGKLEYEIIRKYPFKNQ